MYVPPVFRVRDTEALLGFIEERGFGAVTVVDRGSEPIGAHVPLVVGRGGGGDAPASIRFHVARGNPLHRCIGPEGTRALVAVGGPDAYVSPDWYETADQVPTWNYVAVHAAGCARLLDPDELSRHVEELSAANERRLLPKRPWTPAKMTPGALDRMLRAIVGVEVAIDRLDGQWKLSQNKREADRAGVVRGLEGRGGDPASAAVAALMRRHGASR